MPPVQVTDRDGMEGHKALRVTREFKTGEIIMSIAGSIRNITTVTRYTVQISKDEHIILKPDVAMYMNHSCDPNVFVDTENLNLVALKNIAVGEELGFFYPSTEWDMTEPFSCACSSQKCLKEIRGAKYLDQDVLKSFQLNNHIKSALQA